VSGALLYLFDDGRARTWAPFATTRPVGELRYGCLSARQRTERVFGLPCTGHIAGPALEGFDEPDARPVVAAEDVPADIARVLVSSRVVLDIAVPPPVPLAAGVVTRLTVGRTTVGWIVPEGADLPSPDALLDPAANAEGPTVELAGEVLDRPWSLVIGTPERVARDVAYLWPENHLPAGVIRVGDGALSLAAGAHIEPGVVVDTREGPVRLDADVRVEGPARLIGPLYVGKGSTVFGGSVGRSSIGPVCKVRGEITDSVLLGFSNKAHDGHLGHAMLGHWVNLGAFTTNSDLKNNYGTIRMWTPDGVLDTGLVKLGCLLGDHVKTGIGTLLNSGTVLGAGSNVFGGFMPPSVVPPFSWGAGSDLTEYRLDRFLEVAEVVMERRGRSLTPGVRGVLERAWQQAHAGTTP
jgi:UDP-N-acetylglucosamine diphosphorylase/glucosamine-1-phosphate N-acetyltransferase